MLHAFDQGALEGFKPERRSVPIIYADPCF